MYKKIVFILLVIASFAKQSHAQVQWITSLPNPGAKFNWNVGDYLRLYELPANGTNYVGFKSPDARTTSLNLIFPTADPTAGQVIAFSAPSGSASTGTWITPFTLTQMSVTSDVLGIKLVNDQTTPGNNKVYGTSPSGVKGYRKLKVKLDFDDWDANELAFGEHGGSGVGMQSDSLLYNNANKLGIGLTTTALTARLTVRGFGTASSTDTIALFEDGSGNDRLWTIESGSTTLRPTNDFRYNFSGSSFSFVNDAGQIIPLTFFASQYNFQSGHITNSSITLSPSSGLESYIDFTADGTDLYVPGSLDMKMINLHPTWNITDPGSTGNLIGLYYNPTETSLAGGNIDYFLYATKGISYLSNRLELHPFGTSAGNTSAIRFYELLANGPHCIGIKGPDARADDITLVLPDNNPTNGQVIAYTAPASNVSTGSWFSPAPIASPTFTGTVTIPTPFTLGATSVTTTAAQLNYLNAATGTTGTASTNVVYSAGPTISALNIAAGDATTTPAKLNSGALNTTAVAGGFEYLTNTLYATPTASNRGAIATVHMTRNVSDVTGANSSSDQPIFAAANDRLTVTANTTYYFELYFWVTNGNTTCTKGISFDGGTCTYTSIVYEALAQVNQSVNNTGTAQNTVYSDKATTTVVSATTTSNWCMKVTGMMSIATGGTMLPQFKFSADPTGTVLIKAGSYMILFPLGSDTNASIGNWN